MQYVSVLGTHNLKHTDFMNSLGILITYIKTILPLNGMYPLNWSYLILFDYVDSYNYAFRLISMVPP